MVPLLAPEAIESRPFFQHTEAGRKAEWQLFLRLAKLASNAI